MNQVNDESNDIIKRQTKISQSFEFQNAWLISRQKRSNPI